MSVTVKHPFVSAVPDSVDATLVRPSNWNADHTILGLGTAAELNAGVANGVATLDAGGKVPISELPAAVLGALSYQGTWNASTNTPTLASGVGVKGYYYVVSVAGSTNLDGVSDWVVGDWAVFNGTAWQKVDNTDAVTSVNGQTGTVVLTAADVGAQPAGTYVTSVGATSPVTSTGGTTPTIAMAAANTSTDGYLTSTDWNTFNSKGSGTVTSVAATASTGISVSGSPITTSGTLTITNTAPDQTVSLTAGTGISTTGTYPNFTITNTAPSSGGTVTSVTGTAPVVSSGGNTPAISMAAATTSVNGYLTSTDWNTFNNKQPAGTYVNSVSATSPITSSGGVTPTIAMPAATTSVNGYLTSTDWNTFNNKTSNLGTVTSVGGTGTVNGITLTGTVTTSGNLTLGGTLSGVSLTTQVSGTLPVANGGTGTATAFTAGSVVFAGASGVYSQDNASLFFDNTNDRLGIGTTTPNQKLQVTGSNSTGFAGATLQNSNGNVGLAGIQFSSDTTYSKSAIAQVRESPNGVGPLVFYVDSATDAADWAAGDEKMRISAAGSVGIGTASPGGKLDVVGGRSFFSAVSEPFAIGSRYVSTGGAVYFGATNGTATPGIQLSFATGAVALGINSSGIVEMPAYGAGTATFSAAGVISSVSDETWKIKDGVPVNPDSMLKKLKPGYWFYNKEKAPIFGVDRQLGFYAQNVNAAIGPEAAPTPEEGKPWGYYDRSVLAITVMSLQKALATIESLTARIEMLEAK